MSLVVKLVTEHVPLWLCVPPPLADGVGRGVVRERVRAPVLRDVLGGLALVWGGAARPRGPARAAKAERRRPRVLQVAPEHRPGYGAGSRYSVHGELLCFLDYGSRPNPTDISDQVFDDEPLPDPHVAGPVDARQCHLNAHPVGRPDVPLEGGDLNHQAILGCRPGVHGHHAHALD